MSNIFGENTDQEKYFGYDSSGIKQKIINAYEMLLKNDFYLLQNNVNERSLTHRLAIYLEAEFPSWHVDCEYNRNGTRLSSRTGQKEPNPKSYKLQESVSTTSTDAVTAFPDIIVHRRDTDQNLLVLEAKKIGNDLSKDTEKLEAFQEQIGYKFAFQVIFPVRGAAKENLNLEKLILRHPNE